MSIVEARQGNFTTRVTLGAGPGLKGHLLYFERISQEASQGTKAARQLQQINDYHLVTSLLLIQPPQVVSRTKLTCQLVHVISDPPLPLTLIHACKPAFPARRTRLWLPSVSPLTPLTAPYSPFARQHTLHSPNT